MFKLYEQKNEDYLNAKEKLRELQDKRKEIHDSLHKCMTETNKLVTKKDRIKASIKDAEMNQNVEKYQLKELQNELQKLEMDKKKCEQNISEMERRISLLSDELNGDLDESSQEVLNAMENTILELEKLQDNSKKMFKKKTKVEKQKADLINELEKNTLKSLEEANANLNSPRELNSLRNQLGINSEIKRALKDAITKTRIAIEINDETIKKLSERSTNINKEFEDSESAVWEHKHKYDNYMAKYYQVGSDEERSLIDALKDCDTRLLQQGTIPKEVKEIEKMTTKQCEKGLEKVNIKLEKIGGVNLKSREMYEELVKEKKRMEQNRREGEVALQSCNDLIETLDSSKLNKVEFTFRQVAKYFEEIFKILVPTGRGRMSFDRYSSQDTTDAPKNTSVSIHVSFNSTEEMSELNQLSGGQKSMVALAYMFAMQKCDPSPIYIFDEIDAHLDSKAREKIALWLQNCKEDNQGDQKFTYFPLKFSIVIVFIT